MQVTEFFFSTILKSFVVVVSFIFVQMTENNFFLKKIEISVSEAEKRTGRNAVNMQETYTAYLVETRCAVSGRAFSAGPAAWQWSRLGLNKAEVVGLSLSLSVCLFTGN